MKKISIICALCILMFTLVGCNEKKPENKAEEVVDKYFKSIQEAKLEHLDELCVENKPKSIVKTDWVKVLKVLMNSDEYSEFAKIKVQDVIDELMKSVVLDYKIKDVKEENGKSVVTVALTSMNQTRINAIDVEKAGEDLMAKYIEDNEELLKDLAAQGESVFKEKVMNEYMEIYSSWILEQINSVGTIETDVEFTLVVEDGLWKIEKIDCDFSKSFSNDDAKGQKEYIVDPVKMEASQTILKKGNLIKDTSRANKQLQTSLEFIDYNVINGNKEEMDNVDYIDFSSEKLIFQNEIHGNVNEVFFVFISDDDDNVVDSKYLTLEQSRQVFTFELDDIDRNSDYYEVSIYMDTGYKTELDDLDLIGYYRVYNNKK